MPNALLPFAKDIVLTVLGKKIQEKLGQEPQVKESGKEVVVSLGDEPKSTAVGATITMASIILFALDLPPEVQSNLLPYVQEALAGIVALIGAIVMTIKKDK